MNFLLQQEGTESAEVRSALQKLVVLEAHAWLGMRFLHQGRAIKPDMAAGIDCLGLLVGVARRLGLRGRTGAWVHEADVQNYGLIPDGEALAGVLRTQLQEIAIHAAMPGDILLFRLAGNPQHLGIATELPDGRPGLLHAYAPVGRVVEHGFSGPWPNRVVAVFRVALAPNLHVIFS